MDFTYEKKENYTQADIDKLLEQHNGFVKKQFKDFIPKDEYSKVVEELKPFKDKARNESIKAMLPKEADIKKYDDILLLSRIADEDDENTIKDKIKKTLESREYLRVQSEPAPETISIKQKEIEKNDKPKIDMARIEGL